jgi:hypothetical protein
MSTWAGTTVGSDNDLTDERCSFPLCTAFVERQFINKHVYLCQQCALLVWSKVQAMIDEYGTPPPPPQPPNHGVVNHGMVYFIATGSRIKIGHSLNPERRLAQYPPDMEVLRLVVGTRTDERRYHRMFADYLRDGREWFDDCDELRGLITEATKNAQQHVEYSHKGRAKNRSDLVVHRNE